MLAAQGQRASGVEQLIEDDEERAEPAPEPDAEPEHAAAAPAPSDYAPLPSSVPPSQFGA